jgi:RNA polymerase sigma factor (sigma-70 family)
MKKLTGNDDLPMRMHNVAEKAIARYAQGLLAVDVLAERMMQDWMRSSYGQEEEVPTHDVLMRLAQRVCSNELYRAWRSSDPRRCELAYDNLLRCLRQSLLHTSYGASLQKYAHAVDDVVNITLEVLYTEVTRKASSGPDDPAAFLGWTRTIMIRQAHQYLQRYQRDTCLSLDEQRELFVDNLIDLKEEDPLKQLLSQERQQVLAQAIMSMNNKRYQQVLLYGYLEEIDERELAQRLHAQVEDIYLWRHRALKALRRKPEVMQALRALRQ